MMFSISFMDFSERSRSHSYSGAKTPSQLTQQFKKETEELNCLTSPPDPWVFLQKVTSIQSCTTTNNIEPVALISRANSIDNDDEISSHSSTNLAFSPIGKFQKNGGVTTNTKRRLSIKEYPEIPTFTADNFSTLHTLCASNPSIDIIRIYTATYPWALKQRDADGNLPLHIALKKEEPSYMVICELLRMSPETARMKDSNGDLPLFLACRRPRVSVGVLRAILQIYPESAKLKAFGNTPLHHLLHTGTASPENVKLLMSFNTNAIKTANNFGNLPLHYLCASERPHILTVRAILSEYPEGITALNHAGETPIQRALGKANDEEMRERIRILLRASTKSALNITQIELLRQLNWEARRVIILLCIELAGRNKQNNENSLLRKDTNDEYTSLMSLYHRCDGIWREIISFL